jgi:hypothetical protein
MADISLEEEYVAFMLEDFPVRLKTLFLASNH